MFAADGEGDAFPPLSPPTDDEVARPLTTLQRRVLRLLRRRGLLPEEGTVGVADPAADMALPSPASLLPPSRAVSRPAAAPAGVS